MEKNGNKTRKTKQRKNEKQKNGSVNFQKATEKPKKRQQ